MVLVLTTGDENAGQEMSVAVPHRASPLRVRPTPGSEIPLEPLSTVLFLDGGTTTPVALQNGSIATPFSTGAAGLAAANNGNTFMVVPSGAYTVNLTALQDFTFIGLGSQSPALPPVRAHIIATVLDAVARFQNALVQFDVTQDTGAPEIHAINCFLTGSFSGTSSLFAESSTIDGVTGTATAIELDDCVITNDVTCSGTLTIRNLKSVGAGLTLTATTINVDADSLRALVFAGATFVGTVQGFTGQTVVWGAAVATSGQFLDLGTRINATSFGEDFTAWVPSKRSVLCRMNAFSNVDTVLTARVNAADTALTANPNGGVAVNNNTFIDVPENQIITMGVTGTAGGQALVSCVLV